MEFCPKDVGQHKAHLQLSNQPIKSSPYIVNVFDPKQVRMKILGQGILGQPASFEGAFSFL